MREYPKIPIPLGVIVGAAIGLFIFKGYIYSGLERQGEIMTSIVGLLFIVFLGYQVLRRK